jgi:ubiquinone/menaquinone biosynthesis C-methylase UbiE
MFLMPGRARTRLESRDTAVTDQFDNPAAPFEYIAAHQGWSSTARFFHSRLHVVLDVLSRHPGGRLLDAGCGPGIFVRHLLETRSGDYAITACDRSPAMVEAVVRTTLRGEHVESVVSRIEDMPFTDARFDVVVALGVLEYTDCHVALLELSRVVKPRGLVLISMLNPASPYRLFEWFVYWPALRIAGRIERLVGVKTDRRHGARKSGIHAIRRGRLCRMMRDIGLEPQDIVYYDVNVLVPPFDKIVRRWFRGWRARPERTTSRGAGKWFGTGYLVVARRPQTGPSPDVEAIPRG